ncbi:MAG: hypothetical protein L3J17_15400 [Candidatus Jettenia sp.]|nr:MAG: hypothetical protein L3J17_15400 [Candidatus Jettenia sp.]
MIKKIITGNILTKLMALVMAVALWLYAINRHTGDVTEVVKLNILVPNGVAIVEQGAEEITIHLRGPQNIIDGLTSMIKEQKIQATYVIEESRTEIEDQEKQTILISREHLNIPNDVKLMGLYPDKVDVVLSKLQQKRLKVNVQKKGEPAIGYSVANEFVFPSEIEVTGPLNTLKEASSINTVPIDIDGITIEQNRTFPWRIGIDKKIAVTRGDKNISVPVECNEDVRVWLQIVEQQDTKFFEKIKIKVMSPADYPYEIKLQDEFTNIKVKGPKLVLDKLNNENILLYIDVTSLKPPGPYKQPIKYVLPKNVELFDKLPEAHLDIRETVR